MKINRYLSPYGGGDCGPTPPNPPCQGPDCPGSGCEPWCDEPCPDGSWPPCDDGPPGGPCTEPCPGNECTGPCCDNGVCICDDCSYGEDGDWHVYWSCVQQVEVIMTDTQSSDVFGSQNNHFDVSQTNLQQDIEIGDNFCGTPSCHDGLIPGIFYPNDCYTYLGKKYGSTPATTIPGGLTHSTGGGYWAGVSSVNGAYYDLSAPSCDNCGGDPEPPSESGCMDPVACNYNPEATGMSVDCCNEEGCTDPSAFNYEIGACCDDGSCCYIAGCTDPNATNYDSTACIDDGSCCLIVGCTDNSAVNYNALACEDDGGCCYVPGCTDPTATNYDPLACYDDGSCEYCTSTETNSCETNGATNMNQFWTTLEVGNYYPVIQPYMTHLNWFINSTNYQTPFANKFFEIDSGGANICSSGEGGGNARGGGGTTNNCDGTNGGIYYQIHSYVCNYSTEGGATGSQVVYSWNDAITFWNAAMGGSVLNSNMDWAAVQSKLNETFVQIGDQGTTGSVNWWNIKINDGECCECTGGSTCGCTDPLATNYNSLATFDDGSCTYCTYGCTDEACPNYDATATCDDGSCNCEDGVTYYECSNTATDSCSTLDPGPAGGSYNTGPSSDTNYVLQDAWYQHTNYLTGQYTYKTMYQAITDQCGSQMAWLASGFAQLHVWSSTNIAFQPFVYHFMGVDTNGGGSVIAQNNPTTFDVSCNTDTEFGCNSKASVINGIYSHYSNGGSSQITATQATSGVNVTITVSANMTGVSDEDFTLSTSSSYIDIVNTLTSIANYQESYQANYSEPYNYLTIEWYENPCCCEGSCGCVATSSVTAYTDQGSCWTNCCNA